MQKNNNKKDELNDKLKEHFKDIIFYYKSYEFNLCFRTHHFSNISM